MTLLSLCLLYLPYDSQLFRILSFASICLCKFGGIVIWYHQNVLPCLPWLEETKRISEDGTFSRSGSWEFACFAQITSVCHSNSALHCDSYKSQKKIKIKMTSRYKLKTWIIHMYKFYSVIQLTTVRRLSRNHWWQIISFDNIISIHLCREQMYVLRLNR